MTAAAQPPQQPSPQLRHLPHVPPPALRRPLLARASHPRSCNAEPKRERSAATSAIMRRVSSFNSTNRPDRNMANRTTQATPSLPQAPGLPSVQLPRRRDKASGREPTDPPGKFACRTLPPARARRRLMCRQPPAAPKRRRDPTRAQQGQRRGRDAQGAAWWRGTRGALARGKEQTAQGSVSQRPLDTAGNASRV